MELHDPLDLLGQNDEAEQRETAARLAAKTEADDFMWLMSQKRGRRIVWRLLERTGVFRLSFNTDALQMAFAEGNRNEGNRTLSQIHELCPDRYTDMLKEAKQT